MAAKTLLLIISILVEKAISQSDTGSIASPNPVPFEQTSALVPMSDYGNSTTAFRILSCWQCFVTAGRMCFPLDYTHNSLATRTGNAGLGVCCKPDKTDEEC